MSQKFKDPNDLSQLLALNVADFILAWDQDEVSDEKMKVITYGDLHDQIVDPLDTRITANEAHVATTSGNPHSVTKSEVSLGNVTDDAQLKRADNDWTTFTEDSTPIFGDYIIVEKSSGGLKRRLQLGNIPSTAASPEQDIYSDILGSSKYDHLTYDDFKDESLVDNTPTTMTFDVNDSKYTFTASQVLQSEDLFDSNSNLTEVTEALIEVLYSDSGTPTIEATADGTNWETITPGEIHEFTNTGTVLKLRFTGSGTGEVTSWALFYKVDTNIITTVTSVNKVVNFYYEGAAQDEDIIIDGIYFNNRIGISDISIHSRVAPTGSNLTIDILKGGSEQSKISTLTAVNEYEKTNLSSHSFFETTDRFGLKIKNVGSVEAGQGLNITIYYYDR